MVQTLSTSVQQADGASIRAFSSFTRRDVDAVRATVRAVAMGHTIQEHDDYDGYLSMLIASGDAADPIYVVAGTTRAVNVSALWGDDMLEIGTFPSIGAAMAVLRPSLERRAERPVTMAATLRSRHGDDAPLLAALHADATPGSQHWPAVLRDLDRPEEHQ